MLWRMRLVPSAIVLASMAFAAVSSSEPPPTSPAMGAEDADDLYRRGNVAYDQKNWQEAYRLYLAAWGLKKSFDIAGNLGDVELRLGKPRDAAEHLAYSFRIFPANGKAEAREKTKTRLAEARAQVLAMTIHTSPASAAIFVDGNPAGRTPLDGEIFASPGSHTVEAKVDGYMTASRVIKGTEGSSQEVRLTLTRAPTALPPSDSGPHPAILLGGTALAISGVALGIGFTVVSTGKGSDADERAEELQRTAGANACQSLPSACDGIEGDLKARDALGNGAIISFVAAGAVGIGTVTYALLSRKPASTVGMRVLPAAGAHHGGIVVLGQW